MRVLQVVYSKEWLIPLSTSLTLPLTQIFLAFQNSEELVLLVCGFVKIPTVMVTELSPLQSPPKESIHFCRAEYSNLRGAR